MRILFITQWFEPETTTRISPLARELVSVGHEVQVLTGFPNYPGGKLYNGYRIRVLQRENMGGVSVIRVPLYPSHNCSSIQRFGNYASFALSAATIGPFVVGRADVAYVYNPPATVFFSAAVVRLLRGIPLVFDIQDMWPDSLRASGMFNSRLGLWVLEKYCRLSYRMAKKIVVISPGFKEILCNRGVPANKIEVIYNWSLGAKGHLTEKDSTLATKLGMAGRFNIMFAGNMGKAQALGAVLDAAEIIQPKYPNIQFVFIGDGVEVENLKQKAENASLENVVFHPRQPVSQIGHIMNLADVLLVHLKDDPLFRITIPGKTQAYLATGKPILIGVRGDAADLVLRAKAGLTCEPENPHSIAAAVEKFQAMSKEGLAEMGENGKRFNQEELCIEIGVKRFEKVFQEATKVYPKEQ